MTVHAGAGRATATPWEPDPERRRAAARRQLHQRLLARTHGLGRGGRARAAAGAGARPPGRRDRAERLGRVRHAAGAGARARGRRGSPGGQARRHLGVRLARALGRRLEADRLASRGARRAGFTACADAASRWADGAGHRRRRRAWARASCARLVAAGLARARARACRAIRCGRGSNGWACEIREGDIAIAGVAARAPATASTPSTTWRRSSCRTTRRCFGASTATARANVVAAAAAAGVRHFIYVSSASVTYPRRTPYAQSKLEAEADRRGRTRVRAHHRAAHAGLRRDGRARSFMMFLDYLRRFPVVPFIGDGSALKRPVLVGRHRRRARCAWPATRSAYGKTYNLSGGERDLDARSRPPDARASRRARADSSICRCRSAARLARPARAGLMREPPLTASAIAGIVNDADLDPSRGHARSRLPPARRARGVSPLLPRSRSPGECDRSLRFMLHRTRNLVMKLHRRRGAWVLLLSALLAAAAAP